MKMRITLLFFIVLGQFLVACSAQPTATPTTAPVGASTAYPVLDGQGAGTAYPAVEAVAPGTQPKAFPTPPADAPEPEPGTASISGSLYSYTTQIRLGDTQFYLTPAKGENQDQVPSVLVGAEESNGDLPFATDKDGNFSINNIPPGKYFLVVWAPYNWVLVQQSESDVKPLLLNLEEGQKYPLGVLYVAWP